MIVDQIDVAGISTVEPKWQKHKIDPLAVAERLWRESTEHALPGEDLSAVDAK